MFDHGPELQLVTSKGVIGYLLEPAYKESFLRFLVNIFRLELCEVINLTGSLHLI